MADDMIPLNNAADKEAELLAAFRSKDDSADSYQHSGPEHDPLYQYQALLVTMRDLMRRRQVDHPTIPRDESAAAYWAAPLAAVDQLYHSMLWERGEEVPEAWAELFQRDKVNLHDVTITTHLIRGLISLVEKFVVQVADLTNRTEDQVLNEVMDVYLERYVTVDRLQFEAEDAVAGLEDLLRKED